MAHQPPARPRATVRDVAARAGVSHSTVSKALNGSGSLRPETIRRVVDAARELDFAPNTLARGLSARRTSTVGFLTTDSYGRFSIPVMLGAENALGAEHISVFMCDTRSDPVRERYYVEMLVRRQVDGLIVAGQRTEPRPGLQGLRGTPVVYTMARSVNPKDDVLVPDDYGGARLAVSHLLDIGRRRIAHITGPESYFAARERANGVRDELAERGHKLAAPRIPYGEWSEQWGRHAARMLLQQEPAVDGIFCGNDQIARGVLDTLRAAGREVPGDVAVVGFDNWEPMVLGADPRLSSIEPNLEIIGTMAAQHLIEALNGNPRHGCQMIPPELVVRESSMPERR